MSRRVALLFVLLAPTLAYAQGANPLLNGVLDEVRKAYNKQERPMVIFDVDGTLFDNRSRILQILKEYGDQELKTVRPDAHKALQVLTVDRIQYMLTDTLTGAGVTEPTVVNNAAVFWSQRFFSDEYLKHDLPTPGSVNFVRTLYSNGARIVYLTARDAPRQLMGTIKSLRDSGFPIGIQGTELIMRPTVQTQDAIFKQQVTNYLRHYGKVIATFDNEPANANVYRRAFPDAAVIVYSAPRAPNPPPLLPNIQPLMAFE
jgi:hypothetical protein